jgi:hypothetical protein
MILTFAKLQRLSGLTKPSAVKAWLRREGIKCANDAKGRPWTTLAAVNRKLAGVSDDGFTLEDPERGLPEERPVLPSHQEQMDRVNARGRWAAGPPTSVASGPYITTADDWRSARRLPASSRDRAGHKAGI